MEYAKTKSAAKHVEASGPYLDKLVLETMNIVSRVVGGTLGPGGRPVIIERYEHDLPPILTKDGVTVFRSIGFENPIAHCVMELARDASVRTATEAGDGTTTATILAEAIVRLTKEYCARNKRASAGFVVRELERTFRDQIEPKVLELSRKLSIDDEEGKRLLRAVAQVSANGDADLADAVMKCFEITGDQGNVTIVESAGPSHYEVEQIQGFPISMGYEESCAKFYPKFINDPGTQRVLMQEPAFLLYHGRINDMQPLLPIMAEVSNAFSKPGEYGLDKPFPYNVVVVATGFSEGVLASLAHNFSLTDSLRVFPLVIPNNSPQAGAQFEFLQDLAALTGAKILDVITNPLVNAKLEDLGVGCQSFEVSRYRSTIVGYADEGLAGARLEELEVQLQNPESELDRMLIQERVAKLSGGIARLRVVGSSNGEMKEKRDRAEDAVCAVRGALKHGCLPGGAWTLLKVCSLIERNDINENILLPALRAPFDRLVENSGLELISPEAEGIIMPILAGIKGDVPVVYDFLERKHVDPFKGGVLDSTPAVLEAIRNAISCASNIGTLGGCVVFGRDHELERTEARATAAWLRDATTNPADERP